jgi:branched-chain amino acid transport system ATP-binding protein
MPENGSGPELALEVEGLSVFYGRSQVLFDFALALRQGEIVALMGRNGAGKTSTLGGLAWTVAARCSALRLAGRPIDRLAPFERVRSGLALVPSGSRAFPNLSVEDNLRVVRRREGGWSVVQVYETFPPLARVRTSLGASLSGGERQMLAVARAMLSNPTVLMLDEPSEGLQPTVVAQVGEILRRLKDRGVGVLLAEQNHRLALEVADRVFFLEKGSAAWSGTAVEARKENVIREFLGV